MITPIKRGDSIRNPKTVNDLVDQVNRNTLALGLGDAFPKVRQSGNQLFILNQTGRDLQPGDAFPFASGIANPYTTNPERLFSGTCVIAKMPDPAPTTIEWGIAAQMIADGQSGWGFDSGVLLARIQSDSSTDTSLDFDAEGAWYHAKLGTSGPARVLWVDSVEHSGSGDEPWKWALVRLGAGAGGAGGEFSVVQAVADGSAGVISTKALALKADVSSSPNFTLAADPVDLNYYKL